MTSTNIWR